MNTDHVRHERVRIVSDGAALNQAIEFVGSNGRLSGVESAEIIVKGAEIPRARLSILVPHFDVLIEDAEIRDQVWDDFRSHERGMLSNGSGMTKEQMTGASLFWGWLKEELKKRAQDRR